jgi:isoquinoline 1-oxidoreductase
MKLTAMANGGKKYRLGFDTEAFGAKEWLGSQGPRDVRVITFVGGGFGENRNRQVVEAAQLAKAVNKPVQVAWSREEEFFYDTFQPSAIGKSIGSQSFQADRFLGYEVFFAGRKLSVLL